MDAIPLAPEDRAILDLESSTVAGHTCKVIRVGEHSPDVAALRAHIAERIRAVPALTRRLGHTPEGPTWVPDDDFDLAEHVRAVEDGPIDVAALPELVARLFTEHLDRRRPLWRLDAVPLAGGGAALVWRLHHALADATTTLHFARALLWDAQPSTAQPSTAQPPHPRPPVPAADDERRRQHLLGFLDREFARSRERSPFSGQVGAHRRVAFAGLRLDELHRAAKELCGATLNDAVLSTVAGAVRRWVIQHHGHLGQFRVKVPVSLHREGDDAANRDSFFTVGIPLDEADPVRRLAATRLATSTRKDDHDAETMDSLLTHLATVSPALERLCARIESSPRSFAVTVSDVPGPRSPVTLLGSPVEALYTIAEIGENHALRVSVISLGNTMTFGLCADPDIVHDVASMAGAITQEARALTDAA